MVRVSFADHLRKAKSLIKARRSYMRERSWRGDEWYREWERGLAGEVAAAVIMVAEEKK